MVFKRWSSEKTRLTVRDKFLSPEMCNALDQFLSTLAGLGPEVVVEVLTGGLDHPFLLQEATPLVL